MSLLSNLRRPAATGLPLIGGLGVVAVSGYAFLGLAGQRFGAAGAAPLSVLWTLSNALGAGLFVPVEQELSRRIAGRLTLGDGIGPVVARAAWSTLILVAVLVAVFAVAWMPMTDRLFGGHPEMVVCLMVVCAGFATQHLLRGFLAGTGRFGRYGAQLALDGALRIGGSVAVTAAGIHSVVAFAAVLAAAPALSVLLMPLSVRGPMSAGGSPAPVRPWVRALGLVVVAQVFSSAMIGAGPVLATLLGGADEAAAGVLIGTLLVARVPLLALYTVQATLVPAMARMAARGCWSQLRRTFARVQGLLVAGGLLGTCFAALAGPLVTRTLLGPDFVADPEAVALLVAATITYIVAAVATQSLVAIGRHRAATAAWIGGALAYSVWLIPVQDLTARVGSAFLTGAAVTVVIAVAAFVGGTRASPAAQTTGARSSRPEPNEGRPCRTP